jgi:D-methionine transport system ATP-binding protein
LHTSQSAQIRLEQVSFASKGIASLSKTAKPHELPPGAHYLLKDISFEVFPGERVAIVGPSGSGKTSLLRLLNRLNEPLQGKIYLDGIDIQQMPVMQLRRQVTLVLQESKLLDMTVRDALTYPLQLRNVPSSAIAQQVSEWLERLHIPSDWLDRTEVQLSVGQRQLVAIARALIAQPKVLLLDEPTSALDAGRGAHVIRVLAELAQTHQTTVFMVNHQLDLAKQFCDRILHLQKGKLLQDLAATQVNWGELQADFIAAEMKEAQEWE